jgi:uncharacterized SAM-binding protein YcdF (DUF218 family)
MTRCGLPASGRRWPDVANAQLHCSTLRRGLQALVGLVVVVGIGAWFARTPLLRTAADLWIVSDVAGPADAAVVFGGGVENRPFAAAAYYRQGLVKKVLISKNGIGPAAQLSVVTSDVAANRAVLLEMGVPQSAIETFGISSSNTHQEVLALRDWARHTGARSLIVPTEIFSARRVRWMLHRAFGDKVVILVPALEPREYRRDNWWRQGQGITAFYNEVSKYIYYRLEY